MNADPGFDAVVDLLGMMACGELLAFERLAHDAALAPSIEDKAELARMAVAEFNHFTLLREHLVKLGADPTAAMAPFVDPLAEFHQRTAASNWLEGLVKAYVGDGLAADFYREIGEILDPATSDLVQEVLADTGHSRFAVEHVRAAIEADPRVAGPLALWGRRLMGEALTQAQRVAGERDALVSLLVGGVDRPGIDFNELGAMLGRLTSAHSDRMAALGLDA
ncbi:ferritin-like fold-containing protein [Sporichthya sp.]|uniref:ferritin-like fold-containing protein n=1 Tax=Sporichthya sp. TaxID=65475 RepID=UPI0025FF7CB0|nr:ferritin-like fold-containing protein [Sporichthya sp.]